MAADGVGDSKLYRAVQRHGFEVAEHVAPKLCLGLQELCSAAGGGGGRRCDGWSGLALGHAICFAGIVLNSGRKHLTIPLLKQLIMDSMRL